MNLSAQQIEELHQRGFLILRDFVPPQVALDVRNCLECLFLKRAGFEEGAYGDLVSGSHDGGPDSSPQIRLPANYAPELHRSACFLTAREVARQVLGPRSHFLWETAIMKQAQTGASTPWHQDEAFRDPRFLYRELTIWVALQDVDESSGCLVFLPGSNTLPLQAHRPAGNNPGSLGLECVEQIATEVGIPCPLRAGDCTIHLPRTLHRSTPNLSARTRIAYALTFGITPIPTHATGEHPWMSTWRPSAHAQRRRWMRRGGVLITAWRRLRRGELRGWGTLRFWIFRAIHTFGKGW